MADLPPAIPAATLVIVRDAADGAEVLMVERAKAMAFAAGAMVFPGGRVDPADRALAALIGGPDPDEAAHRIAAIRETIEEVGLPIGVAPAPDAATLATVRRSLHDGAPFADVLAASCLALDLDRLEPWARWRPAHAHPRIFDTRFYLAASPPEMLAASVDRTENTRLVWGRPADFLDCADAGELRVIFPTRRNLERLAQFSRHADLVAHARAHPLRVITPWAETRDGAEQLCIPVDAGYPVTFEPLTAASRD